MNHAELMDRNYRFQRHIYDLTRKYFLLGRDTLLDAMPLHDGMRVCEVGCGTARNLLRLARRYPFLHLYGLDISREMLDVARTKLARHHQLATLVQGGAEDLDPMRTFGMAEPFDAIFFSYSLSMIPPWREALYAALRSLRPDGTLHLVDFWDQRDLPQAFRHLLTWWLRIFHVRHEPALITELRHIETQGWAHVTTRSLYRRYTLLAEISHVRLPPPQEASTKSGKSNEAASGT